ncbi:hypothetical protein HT136_19660 [Novosphingobium profundi]|uniref:DUF6894 family protein n=1 Tax=Novosphingobium profundi TaxID=1774954 RepID=UPI001BDA971E|nr:hypothetical protein [Novosphingobium profundi]MBT0670589.1 hypothetical protein [Novosphingobium profundi]
MSRFYFKVNDGTPASDDVSADFASEQSAVLAAVQLAGELLREAPERFLRTQPWRIAVLGESRDERFAIDLATGQSAGSLVASAND